MMILMMMMTLIIVSGCDDINVRARGMCMVVPAVYPVCMCVCLSLAQWAVASILAVTVLS